MPDYVQLLREQIPIGATALTLFIHNDQLCAGVIEHRCDGRFERRVPEKPQPSDVVLVICELMAQRKDPLLYVVLEEGAYWPEQFSKLRKSPLMVHQLSALVGS